MTSVGRFCCALGEGYAGENILFVCSLDGSEWWPSVFVVKDVARSLASRKGISATDSIRGCCAKLWLPPSWSLLYFWNLWPHGADVLFRYLPPVTKLFYIVGFLWNFHQPQCSTWRQCVFQPWQVFVALHTPVCVACAPPFLLGLHSWADSGRWSSRGH